MPLKGIPTIISPDLLYALAKMGHGDEILLADCHFPATSIASASPPGATKPILIRADGHKIPELLHAILKLINLDTYVNWPATVMDVVEQDKRRTTPTVWGQYSQILNQRSVFPVEINRLERFEFYERAKKAFIIVQTGETAQYGNIFLTNGLVIPTDTDDGDDDDEEDDEPSYS